MIFLIAYYKYFKENDKNILHFFDALNALIVIISDLIFK